MQLERASSHSGEAGLAGWISTNDVTLFTMVLVVLIALVMNSHLIKRKKQNVELQENLASRNTELDQTTQERDWLETNLSERERQLFEARGKLLLTQKQRDALNKDLSTKLERITNLDRTIGLLATEKRDLQAAKNELVKRGETISREKDSLNQQLVALTTQLEEKVNMLADVESHRNRLNQQAEQLDKIVSALQKKLEAANINVTEMREQTAKERDQAVERIKQLETTARTADAKAEDYLSRLQRAAELFKGLKLEKKNLENKVTLLDQKLTDAELNYQERWHRESRINRELVGINGKLQRVALVFDASGSMKEKGTSQGDRWAEAQQIATTWLRHMDVDECVLIVYSSNVRTFPTDGSLAKVHGIEGEAARTALLDELTAVEPEGWTNTLEAMRKAYTYKDVDTIILFSDGAPTNPNSGLFDAQVAQKIYALCRQKKGIPVNTIGLGNYFDQDLSTFLRTVAKITDGTFLGR